MKFYACMETSHRFKKINYSVSSKEKECSCPTKNGTTNMSILSSLLVSGGSKFEFFVLCFLCDSVGITYPFISFAFFIGKMGICIFLPFCLTVLLLL